MTTTGQNFTIYAGDATQPIFTVYNSSSNTTVLDISSVSEITFTIQPTLTSAVVFTRKKSLGGITFVTDGTNGQFQVIIATGDTGALSGDYLYEATITDALGGISTVATGIITIGRAPLWSYSGDPTQSVKDAVRFLIGDTIKTDRQIFDGEILYAIQARGSSYGAASQCCLALASKYSRESDSVQGELRTLYSSKAKAYAARAVYFAQLDVAIGGALSYAGGISVQDKIAQEQDLDRVQPCFNIGMDDDEIPVNPGGTQHPGGGNRGGGD